MKNFSIFAAGCSGAILVLVAFWFGGFDFDSRGHVAAGAYLGALWGGVLGVVFYNALKDWKD